eukprot:13560901-Ditylum_brightwellii.AAC.1
MPTFKEGNARMRKTDILMTLTFLMEKGDKVEEEEITNDELSTPRGELYKIWEVFSNTELDLLQAQETATFTMSKSDNN